MQHGFVIAIKSILEENRIFLIRLSLEPRWF